jgi:biopolymer transport protein ExbB
MNQPLGLAHFWAQSDTVAHGVAIVLLLMSVATWYIIVGKAIGQLRARASGTLAMKAFWDAGSRAQALEAIRARDPTGAFALVAADAVQAAQAWEERSAGGIGMAVSASEFIGRTLQQSTSRRRLGSKVV